jgi:hypothetical protein
VCDLQGVWNCYDGFTFTDPVIHSTDAKSAYNKATDQGVSDIEKFYETHVCNSLCRAILSTADIKKYIKQFDEKKKRAEHKLAKKMAMDRLTPAIVIHLNPLSGNMS